ncbi:hypothetical protein GCM10027060_26660 [Nesterenkonia halophila]|uniref:helix-turn-helix domain-containing protein n=1 Tax=Nesterenkonia halophila TaxID=302044 RepID=UPI0012916C70|nr:LysR family transcriptional regulator [Nesterenkonia halophila]
MTTMPAPEVGSDVRAEVRKAAKLRRRRDLDDLDYRRTLRKLRSAVERQGGYVQRSVAQELGISQPALSKALRSTESVEEPREGFSGASPYEICQRYDSELIDREQLIDELTRWSYGAQGSTDGYDSLIVDEPGSWTDVELALDHGLIDAETYDYILDQISDA